MAGRSETPVKELSDLLQVSGGPRTGLRIISPELLKREGRGRPQELLRVALEPPADNAYFTQVLFLLFVLFLNPSRQWLCKQVPFPGAPARCTVFRVEGLGFRYGDTVYVDSGKSL
jgi:hypothetical protein